MLEKCDILFKIVHVVLSAVYHVFCCFNRNRVFQTLETQVAF